MPASDHRPRPKTVESLPDATQVPATTTTISLSREKEIDFPVYEVDSDNPVTYLNTSRPRRNIGPQKSCGNQYINLLDSAEPHGSTTNSVLIESSELEFCSSITNDQLPHHTLVAETIETISVSSSGIPQQTVAETAESNEESQNLFRWVIKLSILLILFPIWMNF